MLTKAKKGLALLLALVLVLCMAPVSVFADGETPAYADGTYKLTGITSSFKMFGSIIVADSCKVVIKNGAATLVLVTNSADRYAEIMLGKYADKIQSGDEEGIKGIANEDGSAGLTYVVPLEDTAEFLSFPEGGSVLYVILRYKKGYSEEHDGDWYKPKNDVSVTIAGIEKVSDDTTLPGDSGSTQPQEPDQPETPSVTKLPYTGSDVAFVKEDLTSKFGMLTPQNGSYWALDGDNVVIHIIPKNTTVYNGLHWGAITDELTKDVEFNADGTIDLKLAAADYCGYAHPAAPVKAKDGKTTSDQYYLAIPAKDKLRSMEDVQKDLDAAAAVDEKIAAIGEVTLESEEKITAARKAYDALTDEQKKLVTKLADLTAAEEALKALKDAQAAEEAAHMELTIINNTGMFKAVTASLDTAEDGSQTLVVALSGSSYENLFKGNFEEAKANGNDRTKWIKGAPNAAGKIEFKIPVAADESYLPLVSISNTYLAKYEAGENPLERAFYPRQMELDREAKTLTVGDYEFSKELTIVNNVKMFKPSTATLTTVGGPNSNNYAAVLDLLMGSDAYDKAYIGTKDEAAAASEGIINVDGRTFTFKLKWVGKAGDLDSVVDLTKEPIIISFHSASKDAWYEREAILSESKGTLTFNEVQEQDEDAIVKVVSVKDKNGEAVHFTLGEVAEDNILTKPIAVKVNDKVENEESIDIKWQKDITVPEGTEFPVTIEFEYKNKDENFFMYHFNGKDWEVVGEGKGGKATVTFDSLSPTGLVAVNNPNTADASEPYVWAAAFVVFAAAAVTAVRRRKENN